MKFILFILISSLFVLTGCGNNTKISDFNKNSNLTQDNVPAQNTAINENIQTYEYNTENLSYSQPVEETIASFSTKISNKDPNRQNNITIACNTLNGTIIKAGATFSFCDTVGQATPETGYLKADTYDADGDTIQEYGGGKCQISSTLYNAVLAVPSFTVVERHEHSGPAYYVEEGKDACISYGHLDFKFTNNNNFDIKIYSSNTPDSVDISIVKMPS